MEQSTSGSKDFKSDLKCFYRSVKSSNNVSSSEKFSNFTNLKLTTKGTSNLSDSDDSWLDIPLSQRIGLIPVDKSSSIDPEIITPVEKRRDPKKLKNEEERKARKKIKIKEKKKKAALREAGVTKVLANCHKYCETYVDVAMLERFKITDEIQEIFKEKDAQLILETSNPIESGIHWVRDQRDIIEIENEELSSTDLNEKEMEKLSSYNIIQKRVEADIILKVLHPSDYIPLVNASLSKMELESSDDDLDNGEDPQPTLFEYVTSLLNIYEKNITLIFYGFDKYNSQQKRHEDAEYRAKMGLTKRRTNKNKDCLPCVKKCDLDMTLFDLQVKLTESPIYSNKRVHIIQTETPTELCHIIWCHTKATAMCSIKKSQREQQGLEWYAQADGFGSVDVNSDGDITSLWTKQLMSFTKMSEEMAKAITEVYPCPQSLLSAYNGCFDETEKEQILAGVEVTRRNYTTGITSKKLGPQVSRRIYLFMTTRDGDTIID